jgi:hypothetical protein
MLVRTLRFPESATLLEFWEEEGGALWVPLPAFCSAFSVDLEYQARALRKIGIPVHLIATGTCRTRCVSLADFYLWLLVVPMRPRKDREKLTLLRAELLCAVREVLKKHLGGQTTPLPGAPRSLG